MVTLFFILSRGSLRDVFAEFFKQAASVAGSDRLQQSGAAYRGLELWWQEFSDFRFTASEPAFTEVRAMIYRLNWLMTRRGVEMMDESEQTGRTLQEWDKH